MDRTPPVVNVVKSTFPRPYTIITIRPGKNMDLATLRRDNTVNVRYLPFRSITVDDISRFKPIA